MIASMLRLSRKDSKVLRIKDAYSLHRVVYDLFDDVRDVHEKRASNPSGILYLDKGGDFNCRQILILANRPAGVPKHGDIVSKPVPEAFLDFQNYRFEVTVNPTQRNSNTHKIAAICGCSAITQWFCQRSVVNWGFSVHAPSLQVSNLGVKRFRKSKNASQVTLNTATLQGCLTVVDSVKFKKSWCQGIGRGRAFGYGLLQMVPID